MQKKIIALALAGLASSAAFAQSNVTIYGRFDYGFVTRGGNDGLVQNTARKGEMASGLQGGSRVGFKGAEDLGNGLKAVFQMEFGSVAADEGGGLGASRNAYVGLTSAKLGTLVGGKLDGVRYGVFNKYDAFAGGNVGNFTQMTAQVDRASNALAYISPSFGGFTVTLATATHIGTTNPLGLGTSETAGNDKDVSLKTVMGNYKNGPIDLTLDWERLSFENGPAGAAVDANTALDKFTVMTAGGSYDFGSFKLAALYDNAKAELRNGGDAVDIDTWFVSASAPVGNFLLKATYGQTEDDLTADSKSAKFGIGADYNLSKRTKIYTSYGRISNDSGAGNAISPAANCATGAAGTVFGACTTGLGTNGFDLGIAHTF